MPGSHACHTQLLRSLHLFPVLFHNPHAGCHYFGMQDDRRCILQSTGQSKQLNIFLSTQHLPVMSRPFSWGALPASPAALPTGPVVSLKDYGTALNTMKKNTREPQRSLIAVTQFRRDTLLTRRWQAPHKSSTGATNDMVTQAQRALVSCVQLGFKAASLQPFVCLWTVNGTAYRL